MSEINNDSTTRRDLLVAGGLILGVATAGNVLAGEHEHHNHHGGGANESLVKAAVDCMQASQACLAHCLNEFKQGKTEMADCAQAVHESAIMCSALAQLASLGSQHLKVTAQACLAVCESCQKACDEFAKTHEVCKVCSDTCKVLKKELNAVLA